ncbi:hypothetical protein JB92DRAFT_1879835 [Gautieria morchelliformis]|nr:hypothetical protein JB92DRAFT_1879835 [Gautieria morchelliformis]
MTRAAHILSARHPLPLRWLRVPLLLATVGLSCVCIAVGAQALDRSTQLENSIRQTAMNTGAVITFDMNDIKSTTIVLTLVACLLAIVSFVSSTALIYDWLARLLAPQRDSASGAKARSLDSDDEKAHMAPPAPLPFSTRTLRIQTIALVFLSVWLLAVLIPSTLFSRTRSAHLNIQQRSSSHSPVFVDPVYWDYGFLRCLAAAPWFSLVFSAPASAVTWVAWKYSPTTLTN